MADHKADDDLRNINLDDNDDGEDNKEDKDTDKDDDEYSGDQNIP